MENTFAAFIGSLFSAFADKANLIWGAILAGCSYLFGAHWPLFAFFLLLNVIDYIYGILKAKATDTLNSGKGFKGIVKKVSCWIVIAIAFGLASIFIDVGSTIGVDLAFLRLLGWFVLAIYIINEVTSILENMVALGVDVPPILLKGLSAAKTAVDAAGNKVVPENSTEKKSE